MTERERFNNWWNNKKEHISGKEIAWEAWQEAKKNTAASIIALGQQLADKEETLNAMDLEIDAMKDANRVLNEEISALNAEIEQLKQALNYERDESDWIFNEGKKLKAEIKRKDEALRYIEENWDVPETVVFTARQALSEEW